MFLGAVPADRNLWVILLLGRKAEGLNVNALAHVFYSKHLLSVNFLYLNKHGPGMLKGTVRGKLTGVLIDIK